MEDNELVSFSKLVLKLQDKFTEGEWEYLRGQYMKFILQRFKTHPKVLEYHLLVVMRRPINSTSVQG